ncbi:MAG: CBS domain-containing protein, partial [Firmicutes bacterium]|nr:CBS domain-containing protein [Bacillota bacterium]
MNIAFFITPKSNVTYLYDDYTVRQCLEKMRFHGFAAIPVINRQGHYVGTISEGDLLWRLIGGDKEDQHVIDLKGTEEIHISDVLRLDRTPPA